MHFRAEVAANFPAAVCQVIAPPRTPRHANTTGKSQHFFLINKVRPAIKTSVTLFKPFSLTAAAFRMETSVIRLNTETFFFLTNQSRECLMRRPDFF